MASMLRSTAAQAGRCAVATASRIAGSGAVQRPRFLHSSPMQQRLAAVRPPRSSGRRNFGATAWLQDGHGHSHGGHHEGPTIKVTFVYEKDGSTKTVDGGVGMSVLRVAHANEIDLEGACEASLACSTCHVILEEPLFDKLGEPSDDENDMLDLAFALTDTSRLGCQVILTEDMEGAVFRIPSATRNMYVDGHVPKPH